MKAFSEKVIFGQTYQWWNEIYEELEKQHHKQWEEQVQKSGHAQRAGSKIQVVTVIVLHLLVSLIVRLAPWNSFLYTITALIRISRYWSFFWIWLTMQQSYWFIQVSRILLYNCAPQNGKGYHPLRLWFEQHSLECSDLMTLNQVSSIINGR